MSTAVLGVDVGGTAVKTWRDGAPGTAAPTPRDDSSGERTAALVAALAADAAAGAIGLAVPGVVDDAAGMCRFSVNLGWRDVPIGALVTARSGLRVTTTQDVRAGAAAERLLGAGAGRAGTLVFAPIGTGLAVAVVDAEGSPAGSGWAGEVGQLLLAGGPHAGLRVEQVASAGALARRFGAPGAVEVAEAVAEGDAGAALLWAETVEALADALAWTVAVSGAATVVVGGGLAGAGDMLLAPLRAALVARLPGFPAVAVLPAALGTTAAAAGAALLAARTGSVLDERRPS